MHINETSEEQFFAGPRFKPRRDRLEASAHTCRPSCQYVSYSCGVIVCVVHSVQITSCITNFKKVYWWWCICTHLFIFLFVCYPVTVIFHCFIVLDMASCTLYSTCLHGVKINRQGVLMLLSCERLITRRAMRSGRVASECIQC